MADDRQLREMTCDPKYRKALVTDGRTAVGQAIARELVDAGADIVWVGTPNPGSTPRASRRSPRCRR
jgi:NAD(P)-dependent dehydrogenase (short-subunit alcohol dehydrogenase family)